MALQPFNYADVVTTGEAVKGRRLKNAMIEREMDPDSLVNQGRQASINLAQTQQKLAEQRFDEATQLDNSRYALAAFRSMAMDPTTAAQHYPEMIKRGILPAEADFTQLDPMQIQKDAAAGAARFETMLDAYGQQHSPKATPMAGDIDEYLQAKKLKLIGPETSYADFKKMLKSPLVQIGADSTSTGETPEQQQALAEDLGVPLAPRAPWSNLSDPKEIDKAKMRSFESANKRWETISKEAKNSRNMINDIDRFLFLNETNYTGGGMMVPGVKSARKAFDDEFGEMQSISDKLTPQMRQGMPGAASDRDVAMFRGATVSTEQLPEANENIGLGLKTAHQNYLDRSQFFRAYIDANNHDLFAEQAWENYLNENPIFDPNAPAGSYELNQNRKTWKEHFYPSGEQEAIADPLGLLTEEEKAAAQQ